MIQDERKSGSNISDRFDSVLSISQSPLEISGRGDPKSKSAYSEVVSSIESYLIEVQPDKLQGVIESMISDATKGLAKPQQYLIHVFDRSELL